MILAPRTILLIAAYSILTLWSGVVGSAVISHIAHPEKLKTTVSKGTVSDLRQVQASAGGFQTGYAGCTSITAVGRCVYRQLAGDPHFFNQWIKCGANGSWYAKDSNSDDPSKGYQSEAECLAGAGQASAAPPSGGSQPPPPASSAAECKIPCGAAPYPATCKQTHSEGACIADTAHNSTAKIYCKNDGYWWANVSGCGAIAAAPPAAPPVAPPVAPPIAPPEVPGTAQVTPGIPQNLSAARQTDKKDILVKWDKPSGTTTSLKYRIAYKNESDGGEWKYIDDVTDEKHLILDTLTDKRYYITVRAVNENGKKGDYVTQGVYVTPSIKDPGDSGADASNANKPDAPTGLTAIDHQDAIKIAWTAPTRNGGSTVTGYILEYKSTSADEWAVYSDSITDVFLLVNRPEDKLPRDYRVIAKNSNGNSPPSDKATWKMSSPSPKAYPKLLGVSVVGTSTSFTFDSLCTGCIHLITEVYKSAPKHNMLLARNNITDLDCGSECITSSDKEVNTTVFTSNKAVCFDVVTLSISDQSRFKYEGVEVKCLSDANIPKHKFVISVPLIGSVSRAMNPDPLVMATSQQALASDICKVSHPRSPNCALAHIIDDFGNKTWAKISDQWVSVDVKLDIGFFIVKYVDIILTYNSHNTAKPTCLTKQNGTSPAVCFAPLGLDATFK